MIKFATIGTGAIVEKFLRAMEGFEKAEYRAAYSRDAKKAERFAGEHGADMSFSDLDELARCGDIDGVYIASPNALHCQQVMMLMEQGKHVICEKPLASNLAEGKRMVQTAREKRVVLLEAMRSVHTPGFRVIEENLHRLGTIRRVSFQYCQYSSRYDKFKAGVVENAFKPELSNGSLMDIGVYCVHPLVRLFGKPERLLADALFLENGVDGAGTILASYPGMQAELLYSKITNSRVPSQIQGEKGCMVIEEIHDPRKVTVVYNNGEKEVLWDGGRQQDMRSEGELWVRMIQEGQWENAYQKHSLLELEVMDEARRQQGIVFPADKE